MRLVLSTLAFVAVLLAAIASWGQEATYRTENSPFGEEFAYRIPNELRPMVHVDGLRLSLIRVATKDGESIVPGDSIPFTLTVDLENASDRTLQALVVILLENEAGKQLQRLEIPKVKLKAGAAESFTGKYKADGQILLDTAKIWVHLEIL